MSCLRAASVLTSVAMQPVVCMQCQTQNRVLSTFFLSKLAATAACSLPVPSWSCVQVSLASVSATHGEVQPVLEFISRCIPA